MGHILYTLYIRQIYYEYDGQKTNVRTYFDCLEKKINSRIQNVLLSVVKIY